MARLRSLTWLLVLLGAGCTDTRPRPSGHERRVGAVASAGDEKAAPESSEKTAAAPAARAAPKLAAKPATTATTSLGCGKVKGPLCRSMRFGGQNDGGELGFSLGPALDMDGDGIGDLVAGARLASSPTAEKAGTAVAISGATGDSLWRKFGAGALSFLGHGVLAVPDIDGDKRADLIVSAPLGSMGIVSAYSPASGKELWHAEGARAFGWALALTDDETGDGIADLWVGGANAQAEGVVMLLDGKTGKTLRSHSYGKAGDGFGLTLASFPDVDGDGHDELLVGAPHTGAEGATDVGAAYLVNGESGKVLREWKGETAYARLGDTAIDAGDLDGDGSHDIAIGAAHTDAQSGALSGEVFVYSGKTGKELWHWTGRQDHENFGRALAAVGDIDGDGRDDVAIGAPWFGEGDLSKAGRMEIRSGKTGKVVAEILGEESMSWLGWSISVSEKATRDGKRGLWVSSVHAKQEAGPSAGAVELYVIHS